MTHRIALSRRDIFTAMAALGLGGLGPATLGARPARAQVPSGGSDRGLGEIARNAGRFYGCAVQASYLAKEPDFADAVVREAGVLVPEWELKWGAVEPQRGHFNFAPADAILAFAEQHGMTMRGHTLVWHRNIPAWAKTALEAQDRSLMGIHIKQVMNHFPTVQDWDVVNEVLDPGSTRPDKLRDSPFLTALGPRYIAQAFRYARGVAPQARLVYNDYGVEYELPTHKTKRDAMLRLLESLKREGAPIDAVGIQSHLVTRQGVTFDPASFSSFLKEIAGFGLKIIITELDVQDTDLPADDSVRDRVLADVIQRYVEAALAEPAVAGILTWGLSDRHTWLDTDPTAKRSDGLPSRPLPLDADLNRKPIWHALADAF